MQVAGLQQKRSTTAIAITATTLLLRINTIIKNKYY